MLTETTYRRSQGGKKCMASDKLQKTSPRLGKGKVPEVYGMPEGLHPSQVSGIFQDDPTFEEFCEILRQQRAADYQQAQKDVDAMVRKEEETERCSSSTPTP
jgi:hypothetical protein